ncbi:hypothetical protein [Limnohabitans sp. Jir61]|uniref:hypothetical protein n=1 Tax=Limnohabitans sp. Jir61 TaxID=1826168 RepID=UPI0011B2118F|nr:hypothetical protein [Limnohabitans sp. Jir61]
MTPNTIIDNMKVRIANVCESKTVCYILYSEIETPNDTSKWNSDYFFDLEHHFSQANWTPVTYSASFELPCLYIVETHGADISNLLWELRAKANSNSVISLWHFDNHIAYFNNYKSAISCDLNFLTHNIGVPGYLTNPYSAVASHIPPCTLQFSKNMIVEERYKRNSTSRVNKALFNYFDYPESPRASIIKNLEASISDVAEFFITSTSNRGRYWDKSIAERYDEWANHKCTVILPLVEDLSTRVFDALATGLIPIIPENIRDLESAISVEDQQRLGIVRIKDLSPEHVRAGIATAISNFDQMGDEGITARTDFVINTALITHRVHAMVLELEKIQAGEKQFVFGRGNNGIGIYLTA